MSTRTNLWLRDEVKPGERRTAIPPSVIPSLRDAGYTVIVEKSSNRIFKDEEYAKAGCQIVESGSWKTAPEDAVIVGLKELPEEKSPLTHTHVYFGHCYKNQGGWMDLLHRFDSGKGKLLDLEFLVDDNGRRVAAFGRPAGIAGCALGLLLWAHQQLHPTQPYPAPVPGWESEDAMMEEVNAALAKCSRKPKVMVIGALGRCGQGSTHVLKRAGIDKLAALWDMAETKKGGPFPEILDCDILVNCIYLMGPMAPFLNKELIASPSRKLSVVVDVSCDASNPNNPLPIYNTCTTLSDPVERVISSENPLDVISIDHLPTLLPREASTAFATDLLPSLLDLKVPASPVWSRAEKLYHEKVGDMKTKRDSKDD